jgi:hypothetical protein
MLYHTIKELRHLKFQLYVLMSLESNGVVTPGAGVALLHLVGEWDTLLFLLTLLFLEGVPKETLFILLETETEGVTLWILLTTLFSFGELPCVVGATEEGLVLLFELFFCGVIGVILETAAAPLFLLLTTGGVEKDTE